MNKLEKKKLDQLKGHLSKIDRISFLPWAVLDIILGYLPIKDAIRTSILSRQWRYKWVNLSKLLIDDSCLPITNHLVLVNFIYHVLLTHCGHIHTFKLSTIDAPEFSDFDSWMHILARNGVRELTLKNSSLVDTDELPSSTDIYKVPPSIFLCQQLTRLHIDGDLPKPPNSIKGFRSLVSLHLWGYFTNAEVYTNLICNCPVLEELVLVVQKDLPNLAHFNIQAPKLLSLSLEGTFGDIVLENCPVLSDITISLNSEVTVVEHHHQMTCNLVQDMGRLSNMKSLRLSGFIFKYLHMRGASKSIFTASSHLKVLELDQIYFSDLGELTVALMILSLFSNLQELYISVESRVCSKESFEFLETQSQSSSCCFNLLQTVKMNMFSVRYCDTDFNYWHPELEFIKFLLARAPILEKMAIVSDDRIDEADRIFMRELLSFERASAEVRIVYYSHSRYNQPVN